MISAVVLTRNEKNLKKCLESVSWCDEIILVDDYSDILKIKTPEVKIFKRHLNNDFAAQRNFGLEKARGEWVMFLDSDEIISEELQKEIIKSLKVKGFNGFMFQRLDYFGGRWLKHGETAQVRLLRLARQGTGEWQRKVHETWQVKGKIGQLHNPLLHYPHPTLSQFLESVNFYSTLHAEALFEEKVKTNLGQIIFYPTAKFIKNYFLRRGLMDGRPGLVVALMMSFHSFLARGKLYFKWQK